MPRGLSLHLGLNAVNPDAYAGWDGQLTACEYDARDMQGIAEQEGFASKVFLTEEATASALFSSIRKAAAALGSGDIFLLTYSGHGSQLPDVDGDESEGYDETMCLFDVEVRDDQLYSAFAAFAPGVRVLTISDSCHSGTVVRAARELQDMGQPVKVRTRIGQRGSGSEISTWARGGEEKTDSEPEPGVPAIRGVPEEDASAAYQQNQWFYDLTSAIGPKSRDLHINCSVKLLAACKENQVALDGQRNGRFTAELRRVWDDGTFSGTYEDFMSEISHGMPQTQSSTLFNTGIPSREYDNQRPFTI